MVFVIQLTILRNREDEDNLATIAARALLIDSLCNVLMYLHRKYPEAKATRFCFLTMSVFTVLEARG